MFLTFVFMDELDHSTHIFHISKKGRKSPFYKPLTSSAEFPHFFFYFKPFPSIF